MRLRGGKSGTKLQQTNKKQGSWAEPSCHLHLNLTSGCSLASGQNVVVYDQQPSGGGGREHEAGQDIFPRSYHVSR